MYVHSRSSRFRLLCLFVLSFLLLVVQVRAESDDEDDESPGGGREFASLNVQIDERGAARVIFALAVKPGETAVLKKSLSEALGFPLQIDNEHSSTFIKETQSVWWFLDAHNNHAFPRQGLTSSGRMNLPPLLSALRQAEVKQLSLSILFEGKVRNLHVTGASNTPSAVGHGLRLGHRRRHLPARPTAQTLPAFNRKNRAPVPNR